MLIGGHRIRTWIASAVTTGTLGLLSYGITMSVRTYDEPVGAVSAGLAEPLLMLTGLIALLVIWRVARSSPARLLRFALLLLAAANVLMYVIATLATMSLWPAVLLGRILATIAVSGPITVAFGLLTIHWWTEDLNRS